MDETTRSLLARAKTYQSLGDAGTLWAAHLLIDAMIAEIERLTTDPTVDGFWKRWGGVGTPNLPLWQWISEDGTVDAVIISLPNYDSKNALLPDDPAHWFVRIYEAAEGGIHPIASAVGTLQYGSEVAHGSGDGTVTECKAAALAFLREHGIEPKGVYSKWVRQMWG